MDIPLSQRWVEGEEEEGKIRCRVSLSYTASPLAIKPGCTQYTLSAHCRTV
jgi:hypothetical protein